MMAKLLTSRYEGRSSCYSNGRSKNTSVGKDKFSVNTNRRTIKSRLPI